jgi:ubiquinone/menaquinone biosynthesis C-methylase UbiE
MPVTDKEFDTIYPMNLRKLSMRHFTEVEVAITAAKFLAAKPNQKILDIGSGVGKFCFVANSHTDAHCTGVDYRKHFIDLCEKLKVKHRFKKVSFIHADFKEINFKDYDSFYFFNSFQEHVDETAVLDKTIETNVTKYKDYSEYLRNEFDKLPHGTRIATYHLHLNQIPASYKLVNMYFDGKLKCWEKASNRISKLFL